MSDEPAARFLEGRRALVTGSSRGIGRAVAVRLAEAGAHVALNGRTESDDLRAAAEAVAAAAGADAPAPAVVAGDVGAEPAALLERVEDALDGPVDVLVNNAGIIREALAIETGPDDLGEILATDLAGPYELARRALRGMSSRRWGRVVNISSVLAGWGGKGQSAYAAAKAGLEAMTRATALEVAKRGITVNAVAPGLIETDMSRSTRDMGGSELRDRIPLRRWGLPEDVAGAVAWLVGPDAEYVTGQILIVDGGLTLT